MAESLRIKAEVDGKFDAYGKPLLRWVESTIEEVTGTLEIDHPNNKSGWKSDRYTRIPFSRVGRFLMCTTMLT